MWPCPFKPQRVKLIGKRKATSFSIPQDVILHKAESPWRPRRKQNQTETDEDTKVTAVKNQKLKSQCKECAFSETVVFVFICTFNKVQNIFILCKLFYQKELYKKVRSILNKLTPQKFQTLVKQLSKMEINTEERLNAVADLIFERVSE